MKSPFRFLGLASLLASGLAAGYLLGRASGDSWGHGRHPGVGAGNKGAASAAQSTGSSQFRLPETTPAENVYRQDQRLYAYAEQLSLADLPAALSEALHLPLSQRNRALRVLLGRWSELDPAGATKYAMELPSSAEPSQLREAALAAWARQDFDAALAWTLKQDRGNLADCLATLACSIAETDPNRAIEFVKAHAKSRGLTAAYQRVYAIWAERDYEGALAAAQSAESPLLRTNLLYSVLETRAEKAPREVLETMKRIKDPNVSENVGRIAMLAWTKQDLTSAREWALAAPAGGLRVDAIHQCVTASARNDVEFTLGWVSENLHGQERESALKSIFVYTAGVDSDAALQRAQALVEPSERNIAIAAIAGSLAEKDPSGAAELALGLPDEERDQAVFDVCTVWGLREPQATGQWIADHWSQASSGGALWFANNWSKSDPMATLNWIQSLPAGSKRNELMEWSLTDLARGSRENAQRAFEGLETETQRSASGRLATSIAAQDPESAVKWAIGLSDEGTRTNAIKGAIAMWGASHAEDAAKWLDGLPAGPERDAGTQGFAETMAERNPRGAIEWASSIGDELRRENAIRQVVTSWIGRDKAAASAWLTNDKALPDSLRGELQRTAAVAQ